MTKSSGDLQDRQTNSFQKVSEKSTKKDKGSEKVTYSKGSCCKLIFFTQPITYVSGITLSNNNYRRKNSHHNRG